MAERTHGVEAVGDVRHASRDGLNGLLVGGVGVAHGGDRAGRYDGVYELASARQLRRDRHLHDVAFGGIPQLAILAGAGGAQPARRERALSDGVDVGALEVEAEDARAARDGPHDGREGAETADDLCVVGAGGADEEAGDAAGGDPAGVGTDLLGLVGHEAEAAAAMDVDVDEAGGEVAAACVDDGRGGRRRFAGREHGGDAISVEQQPAIADGVVEDEAGVGDGGGHAVGWYRDMDTSPLLCARSS